MPEERYTKNEWYIHIQSLVLCMFQMNRYYINLPSLNLAIEFRFLNTSKTNIRSL